MNILLRLVMRQLGVSPINFLIPTSLGSVYLFGGSILLTFPTWAAKQLKSHLCILWEGTRILSLRLQYCLLTTPPLSLHPPPAPINNRLEPREGCGGWMKPISCKQEIGDTERLLCPGAPLGLPAQFHHITEPPEFSDFIVFKNQLLMSVFWQKMVMSWLWKISATGISKLSKKQTKK